MTGFGEETHAARLDLARALREVAAFLRWMLLPRLPGRRRPTGAR